MRASVLSLPTAPGADTFAEQLRRHRRSLGLTQEALAERAALSVRAISDLERGVKAPQRATLDLLVRALGLPAKEADAFVRAAQRRRPRRDDHAERGEQPRHNLPNPLTSFIGRERDIAALQRLLVSARLVTVTGAGGCGKTRLALRLAELTLSHFPDGVWFVDLAPLTEGAAVARAMLAALGRREAPGKPPEAALTGHLLHRRLLLLLDNCEHLVAACGTIAETVLKACPNVRFLATSREVLGVDGEAAYRVPTLGLPDPSRPLDPETALCAEAVCLFMARAALVRPGFTLTAANVGAVVAIGRRLDGIPLAIELAAARLRVLAPEQLLARLDDRFSLLTGGRLALPRHQTLRAAIDWSHDLLGEPERRLFRRLAVFSGGCTVEAVEAVASDEAIPQNEVLALLTGLVDKSLAQVEEAGPEVRIRLLETIRQYADGQLLAAGEAAATRERHLYYFLERAGRERMAIGLWGPHGARTEWVASDYANLLSALDWAERAVSEAGPTALAADAGLRLAVAMWPSWRWHGTLAEAIVHFRRLLGLGDSWTYNGSATLVRGLALARLAHLLYHAGIAAARPVAEQAGTILRTVGDQCALVEGLCILTQAAYGEGDDVGAYTVGEEAVAAARAMRDADKVGIALYVRSCAARSAGAFAQARVYAEEGVALLRAAGDDYFLAAVLGDVGFIATEAGNAVAARQAFAEALDRAGNTAHLYVRARSLAGLACVAMLAGDAEQSSRLFAAAAAAMESQGAALARADRRTADPRLAVVREELGPAAFAAAWAEGQAMSLEDAVAEALRQD